MSDVELAEFLLARYAAEVEAKRRIVAACSEALENEARANASWQMYGPEFWDTSTAVDPGVMLSLLALPYADHPDYQPEWKL